jgi:APA family basic amino acid/polyamine antiporter
MPYNSDITKSADKLFPDWIPVAGLLSCLGLAATLNIHIIASGLALLAGGFVVRWFVHFKKV